MSALFLLVTIPRGALRSYFLGVCVYLFITVFMDQGSDIHIGQLFNVVVNSFFIQ